MSVTGLRSLSTFAIGFLLTGIISPVFQMVGRSWMAADSWKMKWMMGRRLYMHFLSRSVPVFVWARSFPSVYFTKYFDYVILFNFDWGVIT